MQKGLFYAQKGSPHTLRYSHVHFTGDFTGHFGFDRGSSCTLPNSLESGHPSSESRDL